MSFKSAKLRESLLDATERRKAWRCETSRILRETQEMFAEVNEKLDRLMTHLKVPPKPPAGFVKE